MALRLFVLGVDLSLPDGVRWLKMRADVIIFIDSLEFLRKITVVGDSCTNPFTRRVLVFCSVDLEFFHPT